ncbi:MAG: GNAT family N-acetyltransferase [Ignavibacteria bacterium]|nr:GNAT family N-acetyltransferase [Ignavibacteria bacterium]
MNTETEIRIITHGSDEYREELELRNRILRIPLGLDVYKDDLSNEIMDIHIGAFSGGALTGVLVLTILNDHEIKMRQVAVDAELQGKGIGRKLVEFSEQMARDMGFPKMTMHARLEAIPFYEKLGYSKAGEQFTEVTIPHFKLEKTIA